MVDDPGSPSPDRNDDQALITRVRRQGHIQEATPGNIAIILQGMLDRFAGVPIMWSPTIIRLNSSRAAGNNSLIVRFRDP